MSANPFELIPKIFRYHVFCCFQQRPPGHPKGSCGGRGGGALWDRLSAAIEGRKLPRVAVAASGCLGFCTAGPLMVVYPEGVWYRPRTEDDIDEIVQSHFVEGRLVERLVVILERF
jgi:(2Fe-2S) ferredoxin